MDTIIKVRCTDQVLTFENTPVIASGGLGADFVSFVFCSKWDGFAKTAVFWRSEKDVYHIALDENGSCAIPPEVLEDEGVIYFGVFGVNAAGIQRPSNVLNYQIVEGAITTGTKPSDPTPDIYTQIEAHYAELLGELHIFNAAVTASAEAAVAAQAAVEAIKGDVEAVEAAAKASQIAAEAAETAAAGANTTAGAAQTTAARAKETAEAAQAAAETAQATAEANHAARHAAGGTDPITPTMIGAASNINLINNWYFLDPINQRGQSEYSGVVQYTIDRWRTSNTGTKVTVGAGVTISTAETVATPYFLQPIQDGKLLFGKTVTLSVMMADGAVQWATSNLPKAAPSTTSTYATITDCGHLLWMGGVLYVRLRAATGGSNSFLATKLELGSTQTLAYKDASDSWALTDVFDRNVELLKCCMNTAESTDTYANNRLTALAVGAAKIATGTYVGTGTYGEANPNTLTFDFAPKLIVIASDVRTINGNPGVWYGAIIIPQWPHYMRVGKSATSGSWSDGNVSVSDNTVSWWAGNGPDQLNYCEADYGAFTYTYTAFG